MHFASDNTGPVHPKVMAALAAANEGYAMPYGADELTARVTEQVREVFEAPQASVHLVALGTAANALALATLANPWDAIFCHQVAHIEQDECNAPEFYAGGAKLALIEGADGLMDPDALRARMAAAGVSVHEAQRGPVSITQATELGTIYSIDQIKAVTSVAREMGVATHMDGARFTNALVTLGCTAAEMTWKAGIDAVSFGGTKNGLMGVEAIVFFNPDQAHEVALRRKRAAHLFSKHRYLAAQMGAYLEDGLWLEMAASANAARAGLESGLRAIPGVEILHPPGANMIFARWPGAAHKRLKEAGAQYYQIATGGDDEMLPARLVCDWSARPEATEQFLDILRGA